MTESNSIVEEFIGESAASAADDSALRAYDFLARYSGTFQFLLDVKSKVEDGRLLSPRQVDAVLRCAAREQRPERQQRERREPATPGMYRKDGVIYKVQIAVHGSGRPYAKRLVAPENFGERARFEYTAGVVFDLAPEDKLSLEEARKWGALYGTCCVCGRTLTDETSIARGIGPICEGREWGA
jgi:hypothetical protein